MLGPPSVRSCVCSAQHDQRIASSSLNYIWPLALAKRVSTKRNSLIAEGNYELKSPHCSRTTPSSVIRAAATFSPVTPCAPIQKRSSSLMDAVIVLRW